MIENFSKDELEQIVKELRTAGFAIEKDSKANLFHRARLDAGLPYIPEDIRKAVYDIADHLTKNYIEKITVKGVIRRMKNHDVPEDKQVVYSSILRDILVTLKTYIKGEAE